MYYKALALRAVDKKRKLQWNITNPICKKLLREGWLSAAYHIHRVKGKINWLNLQQRRLKSSERSSRHRVGIFWNGICRRTSISRI